MYVCVYTFIFGICICQLRRCQKFTQNGGPAWTSQETEAGGNARWEGELGGGGHVTWRREAETALPMSSGKSRRERVRPRQGGKSRKDLS